MSKSDDYDDDGFLGVEEPQSEYGAEANTSSRLTALETDMKHVATKADLLQTEANMKTYVDSAVTRVIGLIDARANEDRRRNRWVIGLLVALFIAVITSPFWYNTLPGS